MKNSDVVGFLEQNRGKIFIIHYSCENLNDSNEGYSPRITSIAVLHMQSDQMSSFSMHLVAEEMHIPREDISMRYDEIEKKVLERFFRFAQDKGEEAIWLHWNMTNINFGFETLEHRYRVLTGKSPYHIREERRFNLSALLSHKYGLNYAENPKMVHLMDMNGGKHRDFLMGAEEVTAFKANEFVKMHSSTMCKVKFFKSTYQKMVSNHLRTKTNQLRFQVNELYQNPFVQILGILGILGTLLSLLLS